MGLIVRQGHRRADHHLARFRNAEKPIVGASTDFWKAEDSGDHVKLFELVWARKFNRL